MRENWKGGGLGFCEYLTRCIQPEFYTVCLYVQRRCWCRIDYRISWLGAETFCKRKLQSHIKL